MNTLRGLYVAVLSLVIMLSGCFGSGVFDNAEGDENEDDDDNSGSSGATNLAPLIELGDGRAINATPSYSSSTGEFTGYTEYNLSIYRAIADLDGNIASAGWDFNLDGQIDVFSSTDFRGIDNISVPSNYWFNASTVDELICILEVNPLFHTIQGELEIFECQIVTIAFIAVDDDGAISGELITVTDLGVILYEWANEFASEGTDTSGCTGNCAYTAEDANDDASAGADTLIRMQLTGPDDFSWELLQVTLSVGDNIYTCSVTGIDQCDISQQGGSSANVWEPGEYIFLSEGTAEICSAQGCDVGISVIYDGSTVAGDTGQMVN